MNGRHFEYTFSRQFERQDLGNDGQGLHHENAANDTEEDLVLRENGDRP